MGTRYNFLGTFNALDPYCLGPRQRPQGSTFFIRPKLNWFRRVICVEVPMIFCNGIYCFNSYYWYVAILNQSWKSSSQAKVCTISCPIQLDGSDGSDGPVGSDDSDGCWFMLIDADWELCSLMLLVADWWRLMLINADWCCCWLVLVDADWYCLMLLDADLFSNKVQPGFLSSEHTSGVSAVIFETESSTLNLHSLLTEFM